MRGRELENGSVFVLVHKDGRKSRIFKKVSDSLFCVLIRKYSYDMLEFQPVGAWPGVPEELKDLDSREVALIGVDPNARFYFE